MKAIQCLTLIAGVLVITAGCSDQKNNIEPDLKPEGPNAKPQPESIKQNSDLHEAFELGDPATTGNQPSENHSAPTAEAVIDEIDETLHTISQKAIQLDQNTLKQYVEAYRSAILNKKADLDRLAESLRALPMQDIVGEKGKALKEQVEQRSAQITELEKRYNIYLKALKGWK